MLLRRIAPGSRGVRKLPFGSLGEFEMCPDWVPAMDSGQWFASIDLKTIPIHRFDHTANWLAKVRNVSKLGSQSYSYCFD